MLDVREVDQGAKQYRFSYSLAKEGEPERTVYQAVAIGSTGRCVQHAPARPRCDARGATVPYPPAAAAQPPLPLSVPRPAATPGCTRSTRRAPPLTPPSMGRCCSRLSTHSRRPRPPWRDLAGWHGWLRPCPGSSELWHPGALLRVQTGAAYRGQIRRTQSVNPAACGDASVHAHGGVLSVSWIAVVLYCAAAAVWLQKHRCTGKTYFCENDS